MMSAVDEPQLVGNNTESNQGGLSTNPTNANSLINDAFNINSNSQTLIMPPSSNHFQPIHSRTPSSDAAAATVSNIFTKQASLPPNLQTLSINKSPSSASFFEQKQIAPPIMLKKDFNNPSLIKPPQHIHVSPPNLIPIPQSSSALLQNPLGPSPPQLHTPIPTRPPSLGPPTLLASMMAPPVSFPPTGLISSGNSNPYAAKGALNKKVYDTNIIPVASSLLPATSNLYETNINNNNNNNAIVMPNMPYIPAPMPQTMEQNGSVMSPPPASSSTNFQAQSSVSNSQSLGFLSNFQLQNPGQPLMDLNDKMNTSFNLNNANAPTPPISASSNNNNNSSDQQNAQTNTMWNWFSKNKLVNNIVEKVITTIDPQMKEFIHPANQAFLLVTSHVQLSHAIRESFTNAGFSKITINLLDINQLSQNVTQFAPQIVGFPCALQSVREKLDSSLGYMQQTNCVCLSFQDFLVEITTDNWFEMAVIMLKDKVNNIELIVYTEAIPISLEDIDQLRQLTSNDYPLKWSGFAVRLPEKNFNFNPKADTLSYETSDTIISQTRISHAIKTIALLFKNKLISKM
jgi:hypothetical protein